MAETAVQADRVSQVEARSGALHRELRLFDLVLIQVMYIVGSGWVGAAAKLGPSHIVFWTLAALTFYLPQAAVVIFLNRLMPLEGGLYQWATVGFGRTLGFMVGWNLWAYSILMIPTFAVMVATNLSYVLDPSSAWLTRTAWYTPLVSVAFIAVASAVSVRGLGVGKWLQNAGGLAQFIVYGSLVAIPFVAILRGALDRYHPLAVAAPTLSLLNVNIFSKLALGAFSGFEVRGDHGWRVPRPATLDRTRGGDCDPALRVAVRLRHEQRPGAGATGPDRPGEPGSAGARGRRGHGGLDFTHRADGDPAAARAATGQHHVRAGRSFTTTARGGLGWLAAGVVHQAARAVPDARELDPVRRPRHHRPGAGGPGGRRAAGGLPVARQRRRPALRGCVRRALRHSSRRRQGAVGAAAPLAEAGLGDRIDGFPALLGLHDLSDRRGRELAAVRREDPRPW